MRTPEWEVREIISISTHLKWTNPTTLASEGKPQVLSLREVGRWGDREEKAGREREEGGIGKQAF